MEVTETQENVEMVSVLSKMSSACNVESMDPGSSPASPKIVIDRTPYTIVNEGKAEILFPSSHDVFYNPVQEFNRDMSIAVIKEFRKQRLWRKRDGKVKELDDESTSNGELEDIRILEALAASGLRSVRYAKEISGIKEIVSNDMSHQAVESIKRNVSHNQVEHIVIPSREEAALLMYMNRGPEKRFHVVDLDPYGSPCQFLDAAVQCVQDGGLLIVTSTDTAVLCGNSSEKCLAAYGSVSLKMGACHEMALRILLRSIESHANRYGRYIVPILSLSVDFYIRVFVQIWTSKLIVKQTISKLAMVYRCVGCDTFHLQALGKCNRKENGNITFKVADVLPVQHQCDQCGSKNQFGGPIWQSELHATDFVPSLLKSVEEEQDKYKTGKRMLGMLHLVSEELPLSPLYYLLDKMCSVVHTTVPSSVKFRSAILNAGFRVSLSHAHKNSVKTDAPAELLWDILRAWTKANPKKKLPDEKSIAYAILSKEPKFEVLFASHPSATPSSLGKNLVRYQVNPEPFWGPKMRSKTSLWSGKQQEKQQKHQGKRTLKESINSFNCKKHKEGDKEVDCATEVTEESTAST